MLYNRCLHSAAFFTLLTSTITLALYIPRSKITSTTTTTTTSKTTLVWADQNQRSNPSNEDTVTLSYTCFKCPMNPKLLREIRLFTPAGESGAPSSDSQPRALICEYDINESPCRYDPATGMLLADQPSGNSCARSADLSPECELMVRRTPSQSASENEPDAKAVGPLTHVTSRRESEQARHLQDSLHSSYEREDNVEAILAPAETGAQHHFSAPDATPPYVDPEDSYDPLNLDPNPPPLLQPPSFDEPSTSPSPPHFDHDVQSAHDEENADDITPVSEITSSHDHDSDHNIDLLLDLEFGDYSDVLKLSQEVFPPHPARRRQDQKRDALDEKVAYLMGTITGE